MPPRPDTRLAVLGFLQQPAYLAPRERPATTPLAAAIGTRSPRLTSATLDGVVPTDADRAAAHAATTGADTILIGIRAASRLPPQAAAIATIVYWGLPIIAVALVGPYDARAYPTLPTTLATWGTDAARSPAVVVKSWGWNRRRRTLEGVKYAGLTSVRAGPP